MASEISSLEGDEVNADLLNPESRKFVNDKEYLKFVSIQMWWNFLSGFFLGMYALTLALLGSFKNTPYLELECRSGLENLAIWEAGNAFSEIFLSMHPTIIIMSSTFDYFIYYSIPWRLNRILKTQKEIDQEAREKLEELKE